MYKFTWFINIKIYEIHNLLYEYIIYCMILRRYNDNYFRNTLFFTEQVNWLQHYI